MLVAVTLFDERWFIVMEHTGSLTASGKVLSAKLHPIQLSFRDIAADIAHCGQLQPVLDYPYKRCGARMSGAGDDR